MTTLALLAPARGAYAVTPHDSTVVASGTRGLYVGGGGNIKVTMQDGTVVTYTAVPAGTLLPIRVRLIWSTGTTATSMVGLY